MLVHPTWLWRKHNNQEAENTYIYLVAKQLGGSVQTTDEYGGRYFPSRTTSKLIRQNITRQTLKDRIWA